MKVHQGTRWVLFIVLTMIAALFCGLVYDGGQDIVEKFIPSRIIHTKKARPFYNIDYLRKEQKVGVIVKRDNMLSGMFRGVTASRAYMNWEVACVANKEARIISHCDKIYPNQVLVIPQGMRVHGPAEFALVGQKVSQASKSQAPKAAPQGKAQGSAGKVAGGAAALALVAGLRQAQRQNPTVRTVSKEPGVFYWQVLGGAPAAGCGGKSPEQVAEESWAVMGLDEADKAFMRQALKKYDYTEEDIRVFHRGERLPYVTFCHKGGIIKKENVVIAWKDDPKDPYKGAARRFKLPSGRDILKFDGCGNYTEEPKRPPPPPTIPSDKPLRCELRPSATLVNRGEKVTFAWQAIGAKVRTFEPGAQTLTPETVEGDVESGSITVELQETTRFVFTVKDDEGHTDVCPATVMVPQELIPPPKKKVDTACEEWNMHLAGGADLAIGRGTTTLAYFGDGEFGAACPFGKQITWKSADGKYYNEPILAVRGIGQDESFHGWKGNTSLVVGGVGLRRSATSGLSGDLYRLMFGVRMSDGSQGLYSHDVSSFGVYPSWTHYAINPDGSGEINTKLSLFVPIGSMRGHAEYAGKPVALPIYRGQIEAQVRYYLDNKKSIWRAFVEGNGFVSRDYMGLGPRIGECYRGIICGGIGANIGKTRGQPGLSIAGVITPQIQMPGVARYGRGWYVMDETVKAAESKGVHYAPPPQQ